MRILSIRAAGAVAAVVLAAAVVGDAHLVAAATCLRPPVDAPIIRPFDAPVCPWCAGHRGITYDVPPGTPVRAAAAGTVTFRGPVVDIQYVVIRHADGLLATYGGLGTIAVSAESHVAAGSIVGTAAGELYFGLRTGPDEYIDPAPRIGTLDVTPYLVPTDGTAGRPPPDPILRCPAAESGESR